MHTFQLMSIYVGFMLFEGKHYSEELHPCKEVWGYEDIAEASFGTVGKVCIHDLATCIYVPITNLGAFGYIRVGGSAAVNCNISLPYTDCLHDLCKRPGMIHML